MAKKKSDSVKIEGAAAKGEASQPYVVLARKYRPQTFDDLIGQEAMVQTLRTQTPSLTDEQSRLVSETVIESTREMTDKMKAPMIDAVAEVFTEQELRELVAFYEAPTGQALIAKTPELTQKMMAQMPAIMAEMQGKMLQKLCAKVSCAAPPPAPKATKS